MGGELAKNALMLAKLPVNVSAVAVPPTVTPPLDVAARVPEGTASVTVITPEAASTSEMARPTKGVAWLTVCVMEAGSVLTGASLTAVTVTVIVPVSFTSPEKMV